MSWRNLRYVCSNTIEVVMSDFFESIKQGLSEAEEFSKGKLKKVVVHEFTPIDVKNVRASVGLTQAEFASVFP